MDKTITEIYEGIPLKYSSKIFRVSDKYRINPLSLKAGGFNIVIVYRSGEVLLYDKVKSTNKYIQRICWTRIKDNNNYESIESYISSELKLVYIKSEEGYESVWDHRNSDGKELLKILSKLDENNTSNEMNIINPLGTLDDKVRIFLPNVINNNFTYFKILEKEGYTIFLEVSRILPLLFNIYSRSNMQEVFDDLYDLEKDKVKNNLGFYFVDFKEKIPDLKSRMIIAFESLRESLGIVIDSNQNVIKEITMDYTYYIGTHGQVAPEEILINGKIFLSKFEDRIW